MILAKRSEHFDSKKFIRSEANMFILKNLNIEAKRRCRQFENLFRSQANMFIVKNLNIEAK